MSKEFSQWVGDMANTIEDLSIIDRFPGDGLTNLQIRMLFADMFVPYPIVSAEVDDWVAAFCMALDHSLKGHRKPIQERLDSIVGSIETLRYIGIKNNQEALEWLRGLKKHIRHKTLFTE